MSKSLSAYLSRGALSIFNSLLRSSLFNPDRRGFLRSAMKSAEAAAKKRKAAERKGEHVPGLLIAGITPSRIFSRPDGENDLSGGGEALSAADWKRIFAEAAEIGVSAVLLTGDGLLRRRDVLALAGRFPSLMFPFFADETLFREENIALMRSCRNLIPILRVEGAGSLDKTARAMSELSSDGAVFGVSVAVTPENARAVTDSAFLSRLVDAGGRAVLYPEYGALRGDGARRLDPSDRAAFLGRLNTARKDFPGALFLALPADESSLGGCMAAGKGFFYINPCGGAEPCPFAPYVGCSLKNGSLKAALNSPFFVSLRESGLADAAADGGCALRAHEKEVASLLTGKRENLG